MAPTNGPGQQCEVLHIIGSAYDSGSVRTTTRAGEVLTV
jgi:hypothetical protein